MADSPSTPPERTPGTPVPPSGGSSLASRNAVLLGTGAMLAAAVPPTIQQVEDPTMRTLLSLLAIIVVFVLGYLVTPGFGPRIGKK